MSEGGSGSREREAQNRGEGGNESGVRERGKDGEGEERGEGNSERGENEGGVSEKREGEVGKRKEKL